MVSIKSIGGCMGSDSYLVSKERCPKCAELGKDTSSDNLAVYSDGHSWCYACGYNKIGDVIRSFLNKQSPPLEVKHEVFLPADCDVEYPSRSVDWMNQYELDKNDMMAHNILWSESQQRLLFPIFSEDKLLAYWGRYFGDRKEVKWKGRGAMSAIMHFVGKTEYDTLVLCEDIVSAIKLSKVCMALPLFGTHISTDRWKRLSKLDYNNVVVWLDPDMYMHSTRQAYLGQQYGLDTKVILSTKDPKEHTLLEISEYLA